MDRSHGGNIWRYLRSSRRSILDFSVSVNPLGIPERVKKGIAEEIDKIAHYPDPASGYVRDTLAEFHGLSGRNFVVGNGSIELIHLIPRALKARRALIPCPTFSEYEFAAKTNDTDCLFIKSAEKDNFRIDISKLTRFLPKADLVFICNPNNPTGSVLTPQDILPLVKTCEAKGTTLVMDETFVDFIPRHDETSVIQASARNRRLLVLRSLTKTFALPGIRIGYLAGHRETIDRLSRHLYPWNVNTLAQAIVPEVINDKDYMERTEEIVLRERRYLFDNLNDMKGIKAYPSEANFFLCKLTHSQIKNAADLSERLFRRGILIRNCGNFRGLDERFFRIAVKRRGENDMLLSALKVILR